MVLSMLCISVVGPFRNHGFGFGFGFGLDWPRGCFDNTARDVRTDAHGFRREYGA